MIIGQARVLGFVLCRLLCALHWRINSVNQHRCPMAKQLRNSASLIASVSHDLPQLAFNDAQTDLRTQQATLKHAFVL